jgi:hypothetical protein
MTNQKSTIRRISKLMVEFLSSDSEITIKSLEGAPSKIGGLFELNGDNGISSLEGAPEKIGGLFELNDDNGISSLEDAPSEIGFAKKFNKI